MFPFPSSTGQRRLFAPIGAYDSQDGVGRIIGGSGGTIARGGGAADGGNTGIFTAMLTVAPHLSSAAIGFRCAYVAPQ